VLKISKQRFFPKRFLFFWLTVFCIISAISFLYSSNAHPTSSITHSSVPEALLQSGRLRLDSSEGPCIWEQGRFRINFMRTGKDAVSSQDRNHNGCPDLVEDIARQLVVAHHVYVTLSRFPDPFTSSRYKGLDHILVFVRDKTHKILNGSNGKAYDEMRKNRLIIAVARHINPSRNPTPAHEYFHCIQNGASYFKNSWYYEGLARWAEDGIMAVPTQRKSRTDISRLLHDSTSSADLLSSSYAAAAILWRPLALYVSTSGHSLPVEDALLRSTYVDGTPVMKDFSFAGVEQIARMLRALDKADDVAYTEGRYEAWSEKRQRDPANNSYLIKIIEFIMDSTETP